MFRLGQNGSRVLSFEVRLIDGEVITFLTIYRVYAIKINQQKNVSQ